MPESSEDKTIHPAPLFPTGDADFQWDLPNPFTIDLTVAEADLDDYQHTNNAVYLKWCEQVAWAHTDAVGLTMEEYRKLGRAMAVRKTELQHLAPSFLGDRIRVANWIVATDGRLRATRRYQVVRLEDGVTLLRALSMFVCIDLETGRPKRMPEAFRLRYIVHEWVAEALKAEGKESVKNPFDLKA